MPAELISALTLATPELLVAFSALALLMVGAYGGAKVSSLVAWLAVAVLAVAGLFNLLYFVYPGPLVSVATSAAKSLF